jgi:class I fructose-bisphosphate aldolase
MTNIDELDHLSLGKRVRLYRMMYEHGPGNGHLLILPIDQGLEHGPTDFFVNPPSGDPEFQFRLALEGGYSGIALHLGLAEKYAHKYAGKVPIVLKINGKTRIPNADEPISPMTATVEDAVRIGADAIGYTLYVGSPKQFADLNQFRQVKADAERYNMPIIVWAYPRGEDVDKKGGKDSLYAIDYAARVANEIGADIVKLNVPIDDPQTRPKQPSPYDKLELSYDEMVHKVIMSAGKTLVMFSGGGKMSDDDLVHKAKVCLQQGATGLIFGRNLWQREWNAALAMTKRLKDMMKTL